VIETLQRLIQRLYLTLIVDIILSILRDHIIVLSKSRTRFFIDSIYKCRNTPFLIFFHLHLQFLDLLIKLFNLFQHFFILSLLLFHLCLHLLNRFILSGKRLHALLTNLILFFYSIL